MNKCDPLGSHFLVSHFLGWGTGRRQGGRVCWGEAGGGQGVWGEGVEWVVKVVGVRWVEGVVVHV